MNSKERHEARYQRRKAKRKNKLLNDAGDITYDNVFLYENLYKYGIKCCKNVGWKSSVQNYRINIVTNALKTYYALRDGKYKSRGFYEFNIYDRGKLRHIKSIHISERTVQKTLCDEVLTPLITPTLIYDNSASLKGKGIDFAMDRMNCHLQRYFRKHGNQGYVLVFDFKDYFGSANHIPFENILNDRVPDDRLVNLANHFLGMFGEKGYGLGSQISQVAAIALPNKLDHYIKQNLQIKYYARYMDDAYLIHSSKEYLEYCLSQIRNICTELGLTLSEKKTKIYPLNKGVIFLKTKFILTETGKVLRKINRDSIKRERRRLKKFSLWYKEGRFSVDDAVTAFNSWKGCMLRGDNYKVVFRMTLYFMKLFGFCPNDKEDIRCTKLLRTKQSLVM